MLTNHIIHHKRLLINPHVIVEEWKALPTPYTDLKKTLVSTKQHCDLFITLPTFQPRALSLGALWRRITQCWDSFAHKVWITTLAFLVCGSQNGRGQRRPSSRIWRAVLDFYTWSNNLRLTTPICGVVKIFKLLFILCFTFEVNGNSIFFQYYVGFVQLE